NFSHHDDIRILAQNMDEGAIEGVNVGEDLLLDDDGTPIDVHIFDGILDGDDLAASFLIDGVDEIIERSRLARTGRTGDEEKPVGAANHLVDSRGQAEFLPAGNAVSTET